MKKNKKAFAVGLAATALGASVIVGSVAQACGSRNNDTPINPVDPTDPNVVTIITAVNNLSTYTSSQSVFGLTNNILIGINGVIATLSTGSTLSSLTFGEIGANSISLVDTSYTITIENITGTTTSVTPNIDDNTLEGSIVFVINAVDTALIVDANSFVGPQITEGRRVDLLILGALQRLNNYNGQLLQSGSLEEAILLVINTEIDNIVNGESLASLVFQTPTTPVQSNNNFTVTALIESSTTNTGNIVAGTLELSFVDISQVIVTTNVSGITVDTTLGAISAIFVGVDGLMAGSTTTENQDEIIFALMFAVNGLNIGIVNPDNTPNDTFNTIATGTVLNVTGVSTVDNGSNSFTTTISTVSGTFGSVQSNSNTEYQGLELEFTGTDVNVTFTFVNDVISDIQIPVGEIEHVPPALNLNESEFTTMLIDQLYNYFIDPGFSGVARNFSNLVQNNIVSRNNITPWSFVNAVSSYFGFLNTSLSGNVGTRSDFQNNSTFTQYSQTDNSIILNTNTSNFFSENRFLQWQSNISGNDNSGLIGGNTFLQFKIIGLGTETNPIFIFSPMEPFDYFIFQMSIVMNGFSRNSTFGIPTFLTQFQEVQDLVEAEVGSSLSNRFRISQTVQVNEITLNNGIYTITAILEIGETTTDGRTLTGTPVFTASINNGVLQFDSVTGITAT